MPPIAGLQLICAERLDALRQQQRARAHARRRQRGLGAGVAAADHDHVVLFREPHREMPVQTREGAHFSLPRAIAASSW